MITLIIAMYAEEEERQKEERKKQPQPDHAAAPLPKAMPEEYPEILSAEKAARFLGYSKSYIYKLIFEGKIPCYKPRGLLYFKKSELNDFIMRNRKAADYEVSEMTSAILNGEQRPSAQKKKP
jgi:excisionase family DNA binding protein